MNEKWIIVIGAVVTILGLAAFVFTQTNRPQPGEKIEDKGRTHVPEGTKVEYNSNPPTTGSHYADWIRAGVLSEVKDDRNLTHSLEHGYVIMWYKCQGVGSQFVNPPETQTATPSAQAPSSNDTFTGPGSSVGSGAAAC